MNLELKLLEAEDLVKSLRSDAVALRRAAWRVCEEYADRHPTAALLTLLRLTHPHLAAAPPSCACEICLLERALLTGLEATP